MQAPGKSRREAGAPAIPPKILHGRQEPSPIAGTKRVAPNAVSLRCLRSAFHRNHPLFFLIAPQAAGRGSIVTILKAGRGGAHLQSRHPGNRVNSAVCEPNRLVRLHNEFHASQGYVVRPSLKQQNIPNINKLADTACLPSTLKFLTAPDMIWPRTLWSHFESLAWPKKQIL